MKTETLKFEPQLLQRYDERIEKTISVAKENAKIITDGLNTVCGFIGKPLTDAEKIDLLKKRDFDVVMELVRPQYQFPNADDTFNLNAMGKDMDRAESAYKKSAQLFIGHDYSIENGTATLSEDAVKGIERSLMVFTESPEENNLLERSQKMCDLLNASFADKLIDATDQTPIQMGIKYVKYQGGNIPFTPNVSFIKNRYGTSY